MMDLFNQKRDAIADACRKFGVGRLELFGSAVHGGFDPEESDLDFIADFLPPLHPGVSDRFFGLAETLEEICDCPVDLLTEAMIRNPVLREEIDRDRTLIYDNRGQEEAA